MQEDTHDARFDPPGEKTWPGASRSRRASLILALLLLSSYAVTDYVRSSSGPRWLMILAGVIGFGLAILQVVFHRTADSADGNGPYSPPSNITR
jgi:hypothetical protein